MNEEKWWDKAKDYIKDPQNAMSAFSTVSAFLSALTLYTIVSGVSEGFSWGSLWNWKSLAVMFLGGLGVMFVQEDGMIKGRLKFLKQEDVTEYMQKNKSIQDKIVEFEFKAKYTRDKNNDNIKELKENYRIKREHELGIEIENLKSSNKQYQHLENELKRIKKGDIRDNEIEYEPYEISDIFNMGGNNANLGKEEFKDDSSKLQRKSNLYARVYSPIIMLLITTVLSSIAKNIWVLVGSALSFLFLLLLQWYLSYQKKLNLSNEITLPIIQNKNNKLKEADKKYDIYLDEQTKKQDKGENNENTTQHSDTTTD